jgi:hypothetical protein
MNTFHSMAKIPFAKNKLVVQRKSAGGFSTHNNFNLSTESGDCACGGSCPACQKKTDDIRISQPADTAEIEADQIADKVMRMPAGETTPAVSRKNSADAIQRKCSTCEDDEKIIQRKPVSSGGSVPSQSPAHVSNAVSSGGRPLHNETRSPCS